MYKRQAFKDARSECIACHVKDDKHKARLGADCGMCHNARSWKIWDFDHARRTKYALDGAHTKVACVACHTVPAASTAKIPVLATDCVSCHVADDVHGGNFGGRCERCHVTSVFKDIKAFGLRAPSGTQPGALIPGTGTRQ